MLRRFVAVAVATLVGVPALTPPAAATSDPRVRVTGTYQLLVADGHGPNPRETYEDLLVSGTKAYRLRLRGPRPKPGARLTVSGSLAGATLAADTVAPATDGVTATLATTAVRSKRLLVILGTWTAPDAVTQESARQALFGEGDAWHREVSYGAEGLTGDVTPWVTIAGPTGGLCYANHRETMTQAKAAALLLGYDPTAYERTVLYFPRQANADCSGYGGWAYQPGTELWLNGALDRRVTMHELGHSHGLPHASSLQCADASGQLVPLAATGCTRNEYGDPADAMGASGFVAHFSAPQKSRLGWLAPPADLTNGGSVVLAPYEAPGAGVAAAKVTAGTRTYWLEHRTARGADAMLPAGSLGLVVHLSDPAVATQPMLLDMAPDGDFTAAALPSGRSWTSPEGYVLTAGTPTDAGLPVTVVRGSVPAAVTGVTTLVSDGAVTVSWAPGPDGGSPVTEYRITAQPGGATTSVGAAARSATMSGLVNGTSYVLSVVAVNALGAGPAVPTGAVVPADVVPPAPVSSIKGTLKGSRLTLTWVNPASADLAAVVVRMAPGDVPPSSPTAGTLAYTGTGSSAVVEGMSNKVSYAFAIFPRDETPNWGAGARARLVRGKVALA